MQYSSTSITEALSVANDAGRNCSTGKPHFCAAFCISGESVETTISSIKSFTDADAIALSIKLLPLISRRFLPTTPLEPPRAGMTAIVFDFLDKPFIE